MEIKNLVPGYFSYYILHRHGDTVFFQRPGRAFGDAGEAAPAFGPI
jgi:hypothetical protein